MFPGYHEAIYGCSMLDRYRDLTPEHKRRAMLERLRDKETRMDRRMARRRAQITKRNWMMVGTGVFWLTVPFLGVALVSSVWRFCAWVVAS